MEPLVLHGDKARAVVKLPDRVRSTEACELITDLEQLLERRIVAVVVQTPRGELAFVLPGEIADRRVPRVMYMIATAARNALKSL